MIARITAVTLGLLAASQADTLRLRNGAAVTGTWLGGTANEVRFMVDDRVQEVSASGRRRGGVHFYRRIEYDSSGRIQWRRRRC